MTSAAVRPIVLALAPPAPGLSRGGLTPSLELLGGSRLIERLLRTHEELDLAPPLVVAGGEAAAGLREVLGPRRQVLAVDGGRREALRAALAQSSADQELLLLHDAERALTPAAAVRRVLSGLEDGVDAVVPVVALTDSVKEVRPDGLRNIDRSTLAGLQSPRLLRRGVLEAALAAPARVAAADGPAVEGQGDDNFDEILAALDGGARVRTVPGSHSGFAVRDRLTLWQAQISLGLARDTSHRHGLARQS
ncbi:2-C-methyl-D-erythritol 4-phosphate cytidylyltransferase [Brachybacterium sp. YJGR34]|uniref:IspD/TarI family cytidylyltransferase n=1 Tax=Brachybacterium sp. YJGR34 TaxID=2059911 RepID=UPI000E0BEE11|nr:2-C-methyl-D-erythritol 4-phosphate cytidylyltransferase [Brachybacterium sp. YJGR34]